MASTSVSSFLDKENDGLTVRTPLTAKGGRLPSSGAMDDAPLKPGQTPNRAALHNVRNTPMKGLGSSSGPDPSFKTPQVVRPKLKQSPAVGAPDPMTRADGPVPLDDEDYVGEFVPPSQRLPTYFESFLSCGVFNLWGFPCISSTGSTSEDEDSTTYFTRKNATITQQFNEDQVTSDHEFLLSGEMIVDTMDVEDDDVLLPCTEEIERKQR